MKIVRIDSLNGVNTEHCYHSSGHGGYRRSLLCKYVGIVFPVYACNSVYRPISVDEYIRSIPEERRKLLEGNIGEFPISKDIRFLVRNDTFMPIKRLEVNSYGTPYDDKIELMTKEEYESGLKTVTIKKDY